MKEEQYPKDFVEFLEQFKDEESCRQYLFGLKWTEGFRCPKCKHETYWLTAQNLIHCRTCSHQTSLTAGTIFHGTRKSLLLWFHIIWWVVAQKTGVSASNMTDFMGFGSYRTTWTWLQKIKKSDVKTISGSGKEAHELLPHVHMVDSLLKRWLNGTHQGKVSPKYLPYYLDEFAFRFWW
jgi:hypothetical protein